MHFALPAGEPERLNRSGWSWYVSCISKKHMNPETETLKSRQPSGSPGHDDIAQAAYRLYQERGCQEGHDLEYWLEAEQMLSAAHQPESLTPSEYAASQDARGNLESPSRALQAIQKNRRNTATRHEIRQISSAVRQPPRQSQRPQNHSA